MNVLTESAFRYRGLKVVVDSTEKAEFSIKDIKKILTAARKISQETQISEPTVLKVIKSYERTASRKAG